MKTLSSLLFVWLFWGNFSARPDPPTEGIFFVFKHKPIALTHRKPLPIKQLAVKSRLRPDTLCNVFFVSRNYVEIIRQDDPAHPHLGIALGFEFDEANGNYPYTPAHAVVQLKNFGYGGVEFDGRDTCNFTGVSNDVSDDVSLEIESFSGDTITGRFSGLLLNGAGGMETIEEGRFRVRLWRR